MIENIYSELKRNFLCSSAYDFSERFLGKSKTYYSVIKARNEEPSMDAILTLETALKNNCDLLSDTNPIFTKSKSIFLNLHSVVMNYRTEKTKEKMRERLFQ